MLQAIEKLVQLLGQCRDKNLSNYQYQQAELTRLELDLLEKGFKETQITIRQQNGTQGQGVTTI